MESPAPYIDHTLLKPETTADQIRVLCEEAVEFGFASVCVPPVFVPLVADLLYGSDTAAGTVVGFPLGYVPAAVKVFEAAQAVSMGATELDMVIHFGAALAGNLQEVEEEIRQVVEAARGAVVKVIIECCCLTSPLKEAIVERVVRAGAGYVKTSTGFAAGGATVADVHLLSRAEHKLLVTEVLDAGQIEGEATFEYLHLKQDFDANFPLPDDERTLNSQETFYSLGFGLGHNLEVSASIPYVISEKEKVGETEEVDGFGDFAVEGKYKVFDEEEMPFTLTAGLGIKFDTGSDDIGTGTTDISPFLAVSKEMAEHVEGYAVYRADLANHGVSDAHSLTLGAEAGLSETLTLDVALRATHYTSDDEVSSFQTYGIEAAAYVQVAHNLYLIPALGVDRSTSYDVEEGDLKIDIDPANLYTASLSVYFLY